jgi:hypothetical protein
VHNLTTSIYTLTHKLQIDIKRDGTLRKRYEQTIFFVMITSIVFVTLVACRMLVEMHVTSVTKTILVIITKKIVCSYRFLKVPSLFMSI